MTVSDYLMRLESALPGQVVIGGSVGDLCTYRVGGRAQAVVNIDAVADLDIVRDLTPVDTSFLMVGAGSNLLVSDRGFDGIALHLTDSFASVDIPPSVGGSVRAILGGACMLPRVARQLVAAGVTGFEWAVGVPGTVGGAVRMNAGGHGSDMAASIVAVSVYSMTAGGPTMWSADELDFSYRHSAITGDDIVLFAELDLAEASEPAEGAVELSEIVGWRRENQPGGQNAGSVFANPPGDSAGRLIDACGLKGFSVGSAHVSNKHANFIQSEPGGSADDIASLIEAVQARVAERFEIRLRVENRLVGFDCASTTGDLPRPEGGTT